MEERQPDGWRAVALLDDLLPYMVYRAMVLGQSVASSQWEPERVAEDRRHRRAVAGRSSGRPALG